MAAEYQLTADEHAVLRTKDGAWIPEDDGNRDWIAYQEWLAAGGVPDPYVPPPDKPEPPPELVLWSDGFEAISDVVTGISSLGQLGWDNADASAATTVYIAKRNASDSDISSPFAVAMQPGRVLRIENRGDATKFVSHVIVSTEVRDTDMMIAVTPRNSGSFAAQAVSIGVYDVPAGATRSIV